MPNEAKAVVESAIPIPRVWNEWLERKVCFDVEYLDGTRAWVRLADLPTIHDVKRIRAAMWAV